MLGNQLGRKIGRRKMTVFGMRPRHTSIFITTITGSLIAVLTLALAMLFSQDVAEVVKGTSERVDKLKKSEQELIIRVQELAEMARVGTIVWNYEERIALNTIPAGQNQESVKRILAALISVANSNSITKNNELARDGDQILAVDTVLVKYTAEELRQWLKEYTNLENPVGLWVVARENCLRGDPVPVKLESFPVTRIYEKGELVYSTDIVPSEVLLDWHIFLQAFKDAALRKGMIRNQRFFGGRDRWADPLKDFQGSGQ